MLFRSNQCIGVRDTANSFNGLGLPQYVSIPGGITRQTVADSFKVMQKLRVPFGPLQPDGGQSRGVMLMNNVTAIDFLKMERGEVGGDLAEKQWVEGLPSKTILGVKSIFTLKRELVPDGTVYFFSSEEFFGKYFRLQPLTVFMETKA